MRMKRVLSLVLSLVLAMGMASALAAEKNAVKAVRINKANFPDAKFRSYIKQTLDKNGNNVLEASELRKCVSIDVYEMGIKSLKGIERFPNLKELDCSANRLTKLDVSKNKKLEKLDCSSNKLTKLDVSKNNKLMILICDGNKLSKLTLGTNKALSILHCMENRLKSININGCSLLVKIVKREKPWFEDGYAFFDSYSLQGEVVIDRSTRLMSGKKVLYKK